MRGKILVFAIILMVLPFAAFPQLGEDYEYSTELIYGINKNTSGGLIGGFVFKYSTAINNRVYRTFGVELMNIKHGSEIRYNSFITGNFFIWGKQNYLYAVRLQYGRDVILFRKAPQQGVQITAMGAVGPSIGIIAPYYVEYATGQFNSIREPYQPTRHDFRNILGTGRVFQGLQDSELTLGANLKAGVSFEFGTFKSNVTGFEVGFLVDAYTREIPLMTNADNQSVFPTAFITLYYGTRK